MVEKHHQCKLHKTTTHASRVCVPADGRETPLVLFSCVQWVWTANICFTHIQPPPPHTTTTTTYNHHNRVQPPLPHTTTTCNHHMQPPPHTTTTIMCNHPHNQPDQNQHGRRRSALCSKQCNLHKGTPCTSTRPSASYLLAAADTSCYVVDEDELIFSMYVAVSITTSLQDISAS